MTVCHATRAEWTKLRTQPSTHWLLLGAVAVTVALSAAAAAVLRALPVDQDPTRLSLTGITLGQAVVAVLAVLAMGGEYDTGMIRVTLAAMPRRLTVLVAKAAVVGAVTLVAGAVAVAGCLLVGRLVLPAGGHALAGAATPRAAVGSVLYLVLVAWLGLGAATAVRNSAAAIGTVLGLLYAFPVLAEAAGDPGWQRHLQQIGPMTAGLAIQSTTGLDGLPIGPWAGLGVLAAWAAAALLAGGLVLWIRDV
jgi:ABC-2 type transport system permease protein